MQAGKRLYFSIFCVFWGGYLGDNSFGAGGELGEVRLTGLAGDNPGQAGEQPQGYAQVLLRGA